MSDLHPRGNLDQRDEWIFPCDCHGRGDYLRVSWDNADPDYRYLWIESNALTAPLRWRHRIGKAWAALRGDSWTCAEILLDEDTVQRVVDVLTQPDRPTTKETP